MKLLSGIKLLEEVEGNGVPIKKRDYVKINLNAWLNSGKQIQTNDQCIVDVSSRTLIAGLEKSILGMKTSGIRKVKISPHLAYGDKGVPNLIPPNSVLIYEIQILEIIT